MTTRWTDWLGRHRRAPKIVLAAAALSALGVTGASAAAAAGTNHATHHGSQVRLASSQSDPDNIQSGDQTTPDSTTGTDGEPSDGVDTDNIQSGNQTTPDRPSAVQTTATKTAAHKTLVVHHSIATRPNSGAHTSATDGDNVQSGDQTTPDSTTGTDGEHSDAPDTDNIQSGPQSGDQSGNQSGPETPDSGANR